MSAKKKMPRDRSGGDSVAPVSSARVSVPLLTSKVMLFVPENAHLPYSDRVNVSCGRGYGAMNVLDWQPQQAWWHTPLPTHVLTQVSDFLEDCASWNDNNIITGATGSTTAADTNDHNNTSEEDAIRNVLAVMRGTAASSASLRHKLVAQLTRYALQRGWRRSVAVRLPSPLLYPFHALTFTLHARNTGSVRGDYTAAQCSNRASSDSSAAAATTTRTETQNSPPSSPPTVAKRVISARAREVARLIVAMIHTYTRYNNHHGPSCLRACHCPGDTARTDPSSSSDGSHNSINHGLISRENGATRRKPKCNSICIHHRQTCESRKNECMPGDCEGERVSCVAASDAAAMQHPARASATVSPSAATNSWKYDSCMDDLLGAALYSHGYGAPEEERHDVTFGYPHPRDDIHTPHSRTSHSADGCSAAAVAAAEGAGADATADDEVRHDAHAINAAATEKCNHNNSSSMTAQLPPDDAPIAPASSLPPAQQQVNLSLIRHGSSTHINVCCGLFYYQLEVYGANTVRSVEELAQDVDAIRAHAAAQWRDLQSCEAPAAREDYVACAQLMARVSLVSDEVCSEIHRRLRAVSVVNAHTLDTLEAGLFTLVLAHEPAGDIGRETSSFHSASSDTRPTSVQREEQSKEQRNHLANARLGAREQWCGRDEEDHASTPHTSHWLHSVLSVYAPWGQRGLFTFRVHAIVVSISALDEFVRQVCRCVAHHKEDDLAPMRQARHRYSDYMTDSDANLHHHQQPQRPQARQRLLNNITAIVTPSSLSSQYSTSVPNATAAHFLELWLPQKHRIPLRPYPTIAPALQWHWLLQPHNSRTHHPHRSTMNLAQLCLDVIASTEEMLYEDDQFTRRPRILFTHHRGLASTAPATVLLYTAAVEEYLKVLHSSSLSITARVRAQSRIAAVHSVARRLDSCVNADYPLYSIAAQLGSLSATAAGVWMVDWLTADVCITTHVLPRLCRANYSASDNDHDNNKDDRARDEDGNESNARQCSCQEEEMQLVSALSNFDIPARMYMSCMVRQSVVEKEVHVGQAMVESAQLGYLPEFASIADKLRRDICL